MTDSQNTAPDVGPKEAAFRAKRQRGFLRVLFLFFILVFGSTYPSPSWAYWKVLHDLTTMLLGDGATAAIETWAAKAQDAIFKKLFSYFRTICDNVKTWFDDMTNHETRAAALKNLGLMLQAMIKKRTNLVTENTRAQVAEATMMGKIASDAAPQNNSGMPCRQSIVVGDGLLGNDMTFEQEGAAQITRGVTSQYRIIGYGSGNGPLEAYDYGRRQEDLGLVSPVEGRAAAYTDDTEFANGQKVYNAALSYFSPAKSYEYVPFKKATYNDSTSGKSYNVLVPEESRTLTNPQKAFVGAKEYIYTAAGMRPVPPRGKGLLTPEGRRARAEFDSCTAIWDTLVDACSSYLLFLTRPPLSDSAFDAKRKKQKENCANYEGLFDLAPFDNCEKGLSTYEEQRMIQKMCESANFTVAAKADGASDAEAIDILSKTCSRARRNWDSLLDRRDQNCRSAIGIMQEHMAACWP